MKKFRETRLHLDVECLSLVMHDIRDRNLPYKPAAYKLVLTVGESFIVEPDLHYQLADFAIDCFLPTSRAATGLCRPPRLVRFTRPCRET